MIFLTSGTTSIPKGVMLSNNNIVSNVKAISSYLDLLKADNVLLIKNICHVSSIVGELLVSIYNGCTLHLVSQLPTPYFIANYIKKKNISILFVVPSILQWFSALETDKRFQLKSLRIVNCYGDHLSPSNLSKFLGDYPWVEFIYSYGLTEASPRVSYIRKHDMLLKKSSVGKPIDGVTISIVNNDDVVLGANRVGRIRISGQNVMQGYFKNSELTRKTIKDGYLYTNDLGCLDEDGYLFVKGRMDNLIIKHGKNIYPEEIEMVISSIQEVNEVLVVGGRDTKCEQNITAYVVLHDGCKMSEKKIFKHCYLLLEDYKIPDRIIFSESLLKTKSNKIKRISIQHK